MIATHKELAWIRMYGQVKLCAPDHVVWREEVQAMIGVITAERSVSKGVITTTSTFAARALGDPGIQQLSPYRLELKGKHKLLTWLASLSRPE